MKKLRLIGGLSLLGLLAGCAYYPMGLTRAEWNRLSPEQQASHWALEQRELRAIDAVQDARTRRINTAIKEAETRTLRMSTDSAVWSSSTMDQKP